MLVKRVPEVYAKEFSGLPNTSSRHIGWMVVTHLICSETTICIAVLAYNEPSPSINAFYRCLPIPTKWSMCVWLHSRQRVSLARKMLLQRVWKDLPSTCTETRYGIYPYVSVNCGISSVLAMETPQFWTNCFRTCVKQAPRHQRPSDREQESRDV